jgi:Na+/H+-dicarboxylate symporter
MKKWFELALWKKILIGVIVGILIGIFLPGVASKLSFIGSIFINLLQMMLVPLVFFSLVSGFCKADSIKQVKAVGGRIVVYYLFTTIIAAVTGLVMALILQPGRGITNLIDESAEVELRTYSFWDTLVSWFPKNIVSSMANGEMIPVIFFSIFLGITLLVMHDKVPGLIQVFNEGSEVCLKMIGYIMELSPFGIAALMANMVSTLSGAMMKGVLIFLATNYLSCLIMFCIVYPLILKLIAGLSPVKFYRNIAPAMVVSLSTTSSAATLPVSLSISKERMGISEKVSSFTLPLGNTCNMDAAALVQAAIAVFACNLYGLEITPSRLLTIVVLGVFLSIGTAGVKGSAMVMTTVSLTTLGLPLTIIPILTAIWPLIDPTNTTLNITGDLVGTAAVSKKMHLMDEKVFNE